MKKIMIAILILVAFANTAYAVDGRHWAQMPFEEKARYLMGIYEGMEFYEAMVLKRPYPDWEISRYFPTKFPVHVIIQSVDLFYADPTNKLFPVTSALYILTMELDIDKKDVIEAYKARIRQSIRQH